MGRADLLSRKKSNFPPISHMQRSYSEGKSMRHGEGSRCCQVRIFCRVSRGRKRKRSLDQIGRSDRFLWEWLPPVAHPKGMAQIFRPRPPCDAITQTPFEQLSAIKKWNAGRVTRGRKGQSCKKIFLPVQFASFIHFLELRALHI